MRKNILIVEDEAVIAKSLKLCLEGCGYNVLKPVSMGEDAIQSMEKNKPDLILMDIKLRGQMNGYEVITKIRKHSNIPVIFLTGDNRFKIDEKPKNIKACDYIFKPFDFDVVEGKIRKLLDEYHDSVKAAQAHKNSE
ncbi:MAG: response regulator [Candidatus Omnitrophica bacterium]|nr:response regulator [Candidatus Omnitrophota bacterium]